MLVSRNLTEYPNIISKNGTHRIQSVYKHGLWITEEYRPGMFSRLMVIRVKDICSLVRDLLTIGPENFESILVPYNPENLRVLRSSLEAYSVKLGYWGITQDLYQEMIRSGIEPDLICVDQSISLPPTIDNVVVCGAIDQDPNIDASWIMRLNTIDHERMAVTDIRYLIGS